MKKKMTEDKNDGKQDSLRERVYQYLKDAMSSGVLSYGEFLDQDQICERLEVSKTPLRDALIRLMEKAGFEAVQTANLEHWVEQAISRDVILARKP